MSDPRFLQTGFDKQLAHAIEECGEFLAAAGKTQRWGRESVNPLLPPDQQETNEAWLLRELDDTIGALQRLKGTMLTDRPACPPRAPTISEYFAVKEAVKRADRELGPLRQALNLPKDPTHD